MFYRKRKQLKMAGLIRMIKKLEHQVARCSRCGICQSVCPLYKVTQYESDVARGKLMLLDGLMRSFFDDPEGVWQRLDRCLLCGSCAANCPRGVDVVEIFLNARVIISGYRRMSFIKRVMLRKILANPGLFDRMMALGAKWQFLFFRKTQFQLDASCAEMMSPWLSRRRLVPLAPVPLHKKTTGPVLGKDTVLRPKQKSDAHGDGLKVAFFVGCLLDKVFPKVAEDILRILDYHRVTIVYPSAQGCCGIPALASGDLETFNRLVGQNMNLFDPSTYDYLVTGCATCTATIKKIWPSMFSLPSADMRARANRISKKTYDINEFLIDIIGVRLPEEQTAGASRPIVTYHDPCHLRKTLGIFAQPRRLIQSNNAYLFTEMPDADACCGMGGSFNLSHYGLSTDIGKKKIDNIEKTGARIVATGCPACMIQLSDMLATEKKHIRVVHPVALYSEKIFSPETGSR